jgi:AraC-like DNA-binding protein
MKTADRQIVVFRPGALADGVVEDGKRALRTRGGGVITSGSLLLYVARGEGWFRSSTVEGPLRPGTLVYAPAGAVDREISEDHEAVIVTLREPREAVDDPPALLLPFIRHLSPAEGAAWQSRLTHIVELAEGFRIRAEHVLQLQRELAPLAWLKRAPFAQETLRNAFDVLWRRQADPLLLDKLAGAVGYTPNYLNDLARTNTGRPIGKWIADVRMARARNLLEHTNVQVSNVGAACGYDDAAYFARAFRRLHGVPPMIWRSAKRDRVGGGGYAVFTDELKSHTPGT